jgi:hypothetical protein
MRTAATAARGLSRAEVTRMEAERNRLQLTAIARGDRDATTQRVRDAFGAAGVFITDVHLFAGLQTVLTFEAAPERLFALGEALSRCGAELDAESRDALREASRAASDVEGTLALVFAHGDPDLRHDVPAVPG